MFIWSTARELNFVACRQKSVSRAPQRGARTCAPVCAQSWPQSALHRPRPPSRWRCGARAPASRHSAYSARITSLTTSRRRSRGLRAPAPQSLQGRRPPYLAPTDRSALNFDFQNLYLQPTKQTRNMSSYVHVSLRPVHTWESVLLVRF